MDFSQRMGLIQAKAVQADNIDIELKNSLWNVLTACYFSNYRRSHRVSSDLLRGSNFHQFSIALYSEFFKAPIDQLPRHWDDFLASVRKTFFTISWHRVYSLLEFVPIHAPENLGESYFALCNSTLEKENSAYRFVAGKITEVTSPEEINEIEQAILNSDKYGGVKVHLSTSLGFLTDRQNPDYRNSIKESISAVESLAKKLVGDDKATLGQALKILETKHNLHGSLKSAFLTLYGYTSDASGIRHALLDNAAAPTKADARFMLICCSAFINFAIDSVED